MVPTEPHPACIWSAHHRILQFWLCYKAAAFVVMPVVEVPPTETELQAHRRAHINIYVQPTNAAAVRGFCEDTNVGIQK